MRNGLPAPDGDWSEMNIDDVAVKLWLPEVLDDCLSALSNTFEQSKSDLARNALMIHFYGRYVFEQLVANQLWKLTRRVETAKPIPETRYNAQTPTVDVSPIPPPRQLYIRAFGKNTRDLKVWMPSRLHKEIGKLADQCKKSESEYMRRALTAYYLGRCVMESVDGGGFFGGHF